MDAKQNGAKTPSCHSSCQRWLSPGGFYGGVFIGFGLGIMLLAVAVICDWISPHWKTIYIIGLAIFLTALVVSYLLEWLCGKNSTKKDR